jgi:regulator of replication initiation timing
MYAQKEMTSEIMYETLDRAQAEGTKLTLENRELRDRLTAVYNQVAELVKDQFFRRRELETRVAELEEIIKRAPLQQWSAGAPTH